MERLSYPAFPHQDDIRPVVQLNGGNKNNYVTPLPDAWAWLSQVPISDICARSFRCSYEEDLPNAQSLPRWMETGGATLFNMVAFAATVENFLDGGFHALRFDDQSGVVYWEEYYDYAIFSTVSESEGGGGGLR